MKNRPEFEKGGRTILCIGAHPDDCEIRCIGTAIKFSRMKDRVVIMSITDGSSGHFSKKRDEIREIRRREAERAASRFGAESIILGYSDGRLEPTVECREALIAAIRKISPDVIFTNRLNDYHPDHRYTAQLVQDASYMLMVPNVVPEVPVMRYMPAIFHWGDDFLKPQPFEPDVVVAIDDVLDEKIDIMCEHYSQMFEWLPWVDGVLDKVDASTVESRRSWVRELYSRRPNHSFSERYRAKLEERYGDKAGQIKECEAFELCEYGYRMDSSELSRLFASM